MEQRTNFAQNWGKQASISLSRQLLMQPFIHEEKKMAEICGLKVGVVHTYIAL